MDEPLLAATSPSKSLPPAQPMPVPPTLCGSPPWGDPSVHIHRGGSSFIPGQVPIAQGSTCIAPLCNMDLNEYQPLTQCGLGDHQGLKTFSLGIYVSV